MSNVTKAAGIEVFDPQKIRVLSQEKIV